MSYLRFTLLLLLSAGGCATKPPPGASAPGSSATETQSPAASEQATSTARTPTQPVEAPAPVAIVSIPNAQRPLAGIVTGGQPSEDNLREAKNLGYKTVVSLLPESDTVAEARLAQELGLRFVSIPITGAADLTPQNAQKLALAIDAEDAKPLIVHCASGNRVGALLALKAFYVDHVSAPEALALGQRAGLRSLQSAVEERLQGSAP
jgi:protein tyrosine phosphatase (PTP) superfamily phosphohydrolase (DUF442 family)